MRSPVARGTQYPGDLQVEFAGSKPKRRGDWPLQSGTNRSEARWSTVFVNAPTEAGR